MNKITIINTWQEIVLAVDYLDIQNIGGYDMRIAFTDIIPATTNEGYFIKSITQSNTTNNGSFSELTTKVWVYSESGTEAVY